MAPGPLFGAAAWSAVQEFRRISVFAKARAHTAATDGTGSRSVQKLRLQCLDDGAISCAEPGLHSRKVH